MCDFLEKFQTLLVGLLGFTGVIVTMAVNARSHRKLQIRQQQHEAQTIRVALLAELKTNRDMYENRLRDFSESPGEHHAVVPSKVINSLYRTLLPKIGLLSVEEVDLVHTAYLLLEELPYRLRLLVGTDNVQGLNDEFIRIDTGRLHVVASIHEALLPSVRNAVSCLENNV